ATREALKTVCGGLWKWFRQGSLVRLRKSTSGLIARYGPRAWSVRRGRIPCPIILSGTCGSGRPRNGLSRRTFIIHSNGADGSILAQELWGTWLVTWGICLSAPQNWVVHD